MTKPQTVLVVHPSHKMSTWKSTIITTVNSDRFGRLRTCKNCGAEQASTVTGTHSHDELRRPCGGQKLNPEPAVPVATLRRLVKKWRNLARIGGMSLATAEACASELERKLPRLKK